MVMTSQRTYGVEDPQGALQHGVRVAPQYLSDRALLEKRGIAGLDKKIQVGVHGLGDTAVGALERRQRNHDH